MPPVCAEVRRFAAHRFQTAGRAGAMGRPVPDDERAVSIGDRRRVRGFSGEGLRIQRAQAGSLVHQGSHCAGRSRSGIRERHQPVDLGALPADVGRGGDRSRAHRARGLRADLDHHAVDHAGQRGDRVQPEVRIRRGGSGRRGVHRSRGFIAGHGGKMRLDGAARGGEVRRREAGPRGIPPSVSGTRFAGAAGRSRDARTRHRRGPHGAGTRPGRLRERAAVRHRSLLPGGRGGTVFSRHGSGRAPAGGTDRQDGVGSQPAGDRNTEGARRAAGDGEASALVSALLAVPQAGDFPRHRAVVHRHGAQRFPRARAGGGAAHTLDSGMGPGTHLEHDRLAARLVHLAAARMGCADYRILLRRLPRAADRPQNSGRHRTTVSRAHGRYLV